MNWCDRHNNIDCLHCEAEQEVLAAADRFLHEVQQEVATSLRTTPRPSHKSV